MSRYDLVTLGEGQLRLSVPAGEHLSTARSLELIAAGSEANVAGLLAQLGRRSAWASVLAEGTLPERVVTPYRSAGVDLSHVHRTGSGRVALYFLEPGTGPVPGRVTYDREGTPFRSASPELFDWDALLDTRYLLVTGITAALTAQTAHLVEYAVKAAADRGVAVALDVNHRVRLWPAEHARATLEPLLPRVDVLFCSRTDGHTVFGLDGDGATVCRSLRERYTVPRVVTTDGLAGVYGSEQTADHVMPVTPVPVVDRPGAGDAFVGGVLHGLLDHDLPRGLRHGVRAAALALTQRGDLTRISPADLELDHDTDIVR